MKFNLILADCPWRYSFSKSNSRKVENHYPTMTEGELIKLAPLVLDVCEKNCLLFMWSTAPKLKVAMKVMEAWGFEYVTKSGWDKREKGSKKKGMGYWWRNVEEDLLLGRRGKVSPPTPDRRWDSLFDEWTEFAGISAPPPMKKNGKRVKREHSKKPEISYKMIEHMLPDMNRMEMFARKARDGWFVTGNEIDGQDIRAALKEIAARES